MKPLQAVAMGLVVVGIHAGRSWDLLPDPLGWLLVLLGLASLPTSRWRGSVLTLAALALVAACALWLPAVETRLDRADPSLRWAVNLPQLGFVVLLAWALADLAGEADDRSAFRTWRTIATLGVVCAVLPVLIWGGGISALEDPGYVLAGLTLLAVIVTGFVHSGRPWAVPAGRAPTDDRAGDQDDEVTGG